MSKLTHHLPHQPWSKPSRNEQEYAFREEFRERMAAARRREAQRALEERAKWLDDHEGHCPTCGGKLEVIHAAEAHAHQCPNCLGVWLDHETFDRLTLPHEKNTYLTEVLRELLLQWTTGAVKPERGLKQ